MLLVMAGIGLGAYKLYGAVSSTFMWQPAKVDALIEGIFPGAKPFMNYDGRLGVNLGGTKFAIFSPPLMGKKGEQAQHAPGDFLILVEDFGNVVKSYEEARVTMVSSSLSAQTDSAVAPAGANATQSIQTGERTWC